MATRLSAPAGPFTATVGFIDVDALLRLYRARTMRAGMAILLERDDGIAMARWPEVAGLVGSNLRALPGGAQVPPDPLASGEFVVASSPADGLERIVSYRVLQDYPMRLYVSFERDRILGGYLQQRRAVLGFSVLVSAIALGLTAWFTRLHQRDRRREVERQVLEQETRRERERHQAVMSAMAQSVNVLMLALDTDERVLFCNKAFERRFDLPDRSWQGRHASELFDRLYPAVRPLIQRAFAGETSVVEMRDDEGISRPMPLDGDDRGESRYVELTYAPLVAEDGAIIGAYGVARDVTDAKQEQLRLLRASTTDPLTELLNRAGFASEAGAAVRRASERDELVALLYLDLDRFKPVNDEHGHPVGDALLQAVAGRLRHALRPQDLVARVGGDEFAVLLAHVTRPEDAQVVADKLVHALTMPFRIGALELHIGTSVGFCVRWAREARLDELIEQADDQLYRAKRAGKGRSSGSLCAQRPGRPDAGRP
jgi:diguanylate cyclase (GGDEF)-like protein/PAS domain S-box-containing protein